MSVDDRMFTPLALWRAQFEQAGRENWYKGAMFLADTEPPFDGWRWFWPVTCYYDYLHNGQLFIQGIMHNGYAFIMLSFKSNISFIQLLCSLVPQQKAKWQAGNINTCTYATFFLVSISIFSLKITPCKFNSLIFLWWRKIVPSSFQFMSHPICLM